MYGGVKTVTLGFRGLAWFVHYRCFGVVGCTIFRSHCLISTPDKPNHEAISAGLSTCWEELAKNVDTIPPSLPSLVSRMTLHTLFKQISSTSSSHAVSRRWPMLCSSLWFGTRLRRLNPQEAPKFTKAVFTLFVCGSHYPCMLPVAKQKYTGSKHVRNGLTTKGRMLGYYTSACGIPPHRPRQFTTSDDSWHYFLCNVIHKPREKNNIIKLGSRSIRQRILLRAWLSWGVFQKKRKYDFGGI